MKLRVLGNERLLNVLSGRRKKLYTDMETMFEKHKGQRNRLI